MMITFKWVERDGSRTTVTVGGTKYAEIREYAMEVHGYPGHGGGTWNYFVDDFRDFVNRLKSAYKRMLP